ncbi:aquaporin [Microbacterium sp. LRZ72]|uniref:aquaporin n=1 Tax=Microbacterium sp. LRZ72 TaxID=2942481 RepID=UPI0029A6F15E|nr:aquaporin [Microbacterium sp. LRZ72]MDX2377045.1 aquaporin [Microbacterium sp. LRZ72]
MTEPSSTERPGPVPRGTPPSTGARLAAEGFGTFLIVFGLVGAVLFGSSLAGAGDVSAVGVVSLAASAAVGLAAAVAAYAFGPLSGGHFNPALTLGLAAAGRFAWREVGGYIAAQMVGGAAATTAIVLVGLFGPEGWLTAAQDGGFASSGWGALSPGGFGIAAAIIIEVILVFLLMLVVLSTSRPSTGTAPRVSGIGVGLMFGLIYLVSIPVDNGAANPARSFATALYGGPEALVQLWVFIVFPIVGAVAAGWAHRSLFGERAAPEA